MMKKAAILLFVCLIAGLLFAQPDPQNFDVRYYGAIIDGITDDTLAIQAAIDAAAAAGGGVVHIPEGTYLITAPVNLSNKDGVTLEGDGAGVTILLGNLAHGGTSYATRYHGVTVGSSTSATLTENVTLRNFTLQGHKTGEPWEARVCPDINHGILVRYGRNIRIENVEVLNVQEQGIQVESSTVGETRDVVITGCHIKYAGYHGIGVNGRDANWARHVMVSNCYSEYCGHYDPDDGYLHGMMIDVSGLATECTVVNCVGNYCNFGFKGSGYKTVFSNIQATNIGTGGMLCWGDENQISNCRLSWRSEHLDPNYVGYALYTENSYTTFTNVRLEGALYGILIKGYKCSLNDIRLTQSADSNSPASLLAFDKETATDGYNTISNFLAYAPYADANLIDVNAPGITITNCTITAVDVNCGVHVKSGASATLDNLKLYGVTGDYAILTDAGSSGIYRYGEPGLKTSFSGGWITDEQKVRQDSEGGLSLLSDVIIGSDIAEPDLWWKFNDSAASTTVVDTEATANLTAQRNTNLLSGVGVVSTSLSFNGSTDYAENAAATITGSAGAVSLWFKVTTAQFAYVWSSCDGGENANSIGVNVSAAGGLAFSQVNGGIETVLQPDIHIHAGLWYHLVVQSDGSSVSVWVNGMSCPLTATAGSNDGDWFTETTSRDYFTIGCRHRLEGPLYYFCGRIDDVRIFTSVLTAAQISALYTMKSEDMTRNVTINGDLSVTGTAPGGEGGYTNMTQFVGQTAYRLFYSDGSGDVKELALGADGTYLRSNGAAAAPTMDVPAGAPHDAVSLAASATPILGLSTQEISFDVQNANKVLAGPATGADAAPTVRSLVAADIPDLTATYLAVGGTAAKATILATTRAINGQNFDGSGAITVPVNNANDATTDADVFPMWTATQGGNYAAKTSVGLKYHPSTGMFTAAGFTGPLTGNASTATTATNVTNTAITDDTTTAATMYPTWVTANTGNLPQKVSSTKLTFNPNTGMLSATGFTGAVTGNASTASNLSGTPPIPNGTTATTQAQGSNDTKLATDAYVDVGLATKQGTIASAADPLLWGMIGGIANVFPTPDGWWRMNDNAANTNVVDSSGNGFTLTAVSNTNTMTVPGVIGNALEFDGASEYATRAAATFTDSSGSITAWIKTTTMSAGAAVLSSADAATTSYEFRVGVLSTGLLYIDQKDNDTSDNGNGDTIMVVGEWYHIAVTSSGTVTALYVNGVAQVLTWTSGSNTGDWFGDTTNRDNLTIGAMIDATPSNYFNGIIDDVRVYSETLTADQVRWASGVTTTAQPRTVKQAGFVILTPTADSDFPLPSFPYPITIKHIFVQCTGGTNIIGGLDEYDTTGGTIVAAVDADITATAGNSVADDGSLTNGDISAGNYLFWHTTSISGTPTSATVTIYYIKGR